VNAIDQIASLLDDVKIKYVREDDVLLMHWETEHFKDLKVKIVTNQNQNWVYIIALFTNFYDVAEDKRFDLALRMLRESWNANGVKFAIGQNDDIIVVAETNDTDITASEIDMLVRLVVNACDTLWDMYPAE
jgi:hypothetical protein